MRPVSLDVSHRRGSPGTHSCFCSRSASPQLGTCLKAEAGERAGLAQAAGWEKAGPSVAAGAGMGGVNCPEVSQVQAEATAVADPRCGSRTRQDIAASSGLIEKVVSDGALEGPGWVYARGEVTVR